MGSSRDGPARERDSEPDRKKRERGGKSGGLVLPEYPACSYGVTAEGDGAIDHEVGFSCGVCFAFFADGEGECGESNGGRGGEQTSKAFGAKDFGDNSEEGDEGASDKESRNELWEIVHR
jgi:hypothetical protein